MAFGKAAARGLPRAMCAGRVEPPRRKVAKQWIADPVRYTRPKPTSDLGASASLRSAVAAVSGSRLPPVPKCNFPVLLIVQITAAKSQNNTDYTD
jgi:hypothetical protein